jgi:ABC-type lipoprotein export system ATPase subunit
MEVDKEFKKFEVKADAPTVLIVMGMAGSGKTTFVHVSLAITAEVNRAFERVRQADLQHEPRPRSA